jgi:hypothetical protein
MSRKGGSADRYRPRYRARERNPNPLTNPFKHKLAMLAALSLTTAVLLTSCGGSSLVSASAVARCAHAQPQAASNIAPGASSQRQVVAKVAPHGWLRQTINLAELAALTYELYVFTSEQAATEAFTMISNAPNAKEEYGAGGTFRRANVIISTDQGEAGALTNSAESLLNRCVGAGASQSILRTQESTSATSEAPATTPEAAQEPPASEDNPNPGQSPAPTREGE